MSDRTNDSNDDGDFWSNPAKFFKSIGAGPGSPFAFPKFVKASEVRQEAASRSANLLKSWSFLRGIIERHEPTIQKRWSKKSRQQRVKLLLEAWPGMPPTHRSGFDAYSKETWEQRDLSTRYRDWNMFPYINQEDLSKPEALLLFLDARGRCHPSDFAGSDGEAMHVGIMSKGIVANFLDHHVMMLNGVTTATEYGTLLQISDHKDASDWLRYGIQYLLVKAY